MSGRWDSKKAKSKFFIKQLIITVFTPFGSFKILKGFLTFFLIATGIMTFVLIQSFNLDHVRDLIIGSLVSVIYFYSYKLNKEEKYPWRH